MNYLADLTASPGYWLLFAVALWVLYKLFECSCESSPLLEDEPQPEPFKADDAHIRGILAEMRSLRTPLKSHKSMEHAAQCDPDKVRDAS